MPGPRMSRVRRGISRATIGLQMSGNIPVVGIHLPGGRLLHGLLPKPHLVFGRVDPQALPLGLLRDTIQDIGQGHPIGGYAPRHKQILNSHLVCLLVVLFVPN